MRFVRDAVVRPGKCAFIPFISSNREPHGFWDFGTELAGEHVYLSHTAFKQVALKAGYAPAGADVLIRAENQALKEQLAASVSEVERLREQLDAVEVLRAGGFAAGKKPGRKPKELV